jgi:hypothetical protein
MRRTPLRRVSRKRAQALKIYRVSKSDYLSVHPTCEVCAESEATDIHHKLPLGRGGKLNDSSIFLAVCRVCHNRIHHDPKWAEQQGYLLRWKNET